MKKASDYIIHSKSFFVIALLIMLFTSVLALALYMFDAYEIYGHNFSEMGNETLRIYARLFLTSVGSTLAVLSLLMVNRHNKNFFYFGVTGTLLLTANALMSNLMFDAIKWLCVCLVLSFQAIVWNLRKDREIVFKKITTGPLVISIISILILSTIISIGVAAIPSNSVFYNKKPYLDPIQFIFTITGNLLAIYYFVESRIYYMIGNAITLFMFVTIVCSGELLSLIQLAQSTLYLLITIAGYLNMVYINKENNNELKNVEPDICIGPHCNLQ